MNQVGRRYSSGIAYVYIPENVDREKYITDALRRSSISIINDFSERMDEVRVASHVLNEIEFPEDSETLGSMVVWVNIPKNNQPLIVARVPKGNEISGIMEGDFSIKRNIDGGYVSISGSSKSGSISIDVFSKKKSPTISLNASTPNKDAKVEVNVSGDIVASAEKSIAIEAAKSILAKVIDREEDEEKSAEISYVLGEGLKYLDEFKNEILASEDGVNIKASKSVVLGSGKEPVVLGETLSSFLNDFVSAVSSITVATSIGAQPILNKAQVEALKNRISDIKSKYSKTD